MSEPKILVIIPAFNEGESIEKTIDEVRKEFASAKILVVNDGSSDDTQSKAEGRKVAVVRLPFNLGIGAAVQTGFKFAFENNFDVAVQVDGDGQHDGRFLKNIIEPIIKNKSDMVIGSRFLPPHFGYQSSWVRRLGINFFAHLISFLTHCKVTDPTSGFRAYNRKMIEAFAKYYPLDFPEPEALVVAKQLGCRVIEVPVEMRKRSAGHSSIRYLRTLYYMVKVTFAILLNMLKTREQIHD